MRTRSGNAVEEGQAFIPEVSFSGQYYPICGHFFWDNDNGATSVCKLFGFKKGEITRTDAVYDVDAMPVGRCNPGQELTKCTGAGNIWGDFNADGGSCKKGKEAGVTVTCTEPSMCCLGTGVAIVACMVAIVFARRCVVVPFDSLNDPSRVLP